MKVRKIILIVCILSVALLCLSTISTATIKAEDLNKFKPSEVSGSDVRGTIRISNKIIGGITAVGTVVAVVTTMGMGIKYMIGSVEQRAEYKKTMMPMLIGMILLFGVSWIIKVIYDIMFNINV